MQNTLNYRIIYIVITIIIIITIILIVSSANENMIPLSPTGEDVIGIINTYNLITQTSTPISLGGTVSLTESLTVTGSCNLVPFGMIVAYYNGLHGTPTVPPGWVMCDGTLVNVSTGLRSPDLRGCFVMGYTGNNLSNYDFNTYGGSMQTVITQNQLPKHTHPTGASDVSGGSSGTVGFMTNSMTWCGANNCSFSGHNVVPENHTYVEQVDSTGGNAPLSIMPPYMSLYYIMKI